MHSADNVDFVTLAWRRPVWANFYWNLYRLCCCLFSNPLGSEITLQELLPWIMQLCGLTTANCCFCNAADSFNNCWTSLGHTTINKLGQRPYLDAPTVWL